MKVCIPSELKGKDRFKYLVKNRDSIIDMKKSERKYSDILQNPIYKVSKVDATKAYLYEDNTTEGVLKRTIVANTYNWMDSHDDVHIEGVFTTTIKERGNRIPHLHDHIMELTARVGEPLAISEKALSWRELGVDLEGATTCLLLESEVFEDYNPSIYRGYLKNRINQHSVFMRYIKIDMAINDVDYPEAHKAWTAYIDRIGNKDKVIEQGYFFAVREASIGEISCVVQGSNELTPTLINQSVETVEPTKSLKSASEIKNLLKAYKV